MTVLLGAAAGALAVVALFDALSAVDARRTLGLLERLLAVPRGAGRDGRALAGGELGRLAITASVVLCAIGWLALGPAGALVCGVAGPPVGLAGVAARRRRWRGAAAADAPAAARALADALGAGGGLGRALALTTRDGAIGGAGRSLLAPAVAAIELGAPTAEALRELARRAGPGPWPALVAATLLHRDAGGDLARLLHGLADDLDLRARAASDARAASAQARLTARIVVALPVAGAGLGELAAPGTLAAVLAEPLARSLVAGAALLELLAFGAVRRIARVGEG
ncbi:MAG TPA: type II secretion system F family protein [Solirubrobacteraceae bacterium]|mgnify:CR=1 FL=1|nr:type II secretion system F family protein [Solirubrobacteraceae bacterium]